MPLHRRRLAAILFACIVVAGCDSPRSEDLIEESLNQWEEAAKVVEEIRDEKTLREAAPKLDALAQRMVEVNKRSADLKLDAETRRRLAADNRKESQALLKRYNDAAQKARSIPGAEGVLMRFRRSAGRSF